MTRSRALMVALVLVAGCAVASAQAAFRSWADTPPIRRARVMFKFLELINKHRDELAPAQGV